MPKLQKRHWPYITISERRPNMGNTQKQLHKWGDRNKAYPLPSTLPTLPCIQILQKPSKVVGSNPEWIWWRITGRKFKTSTSNCLDPKPRVKYGYPPWFGNSGTQHGTSGTKETTCYTPRRTHKNRSSKTDQQYNRLPPQYRHNRSSSYM